jgi:chorismate synthase
MPGSIFGTLFRISTWGESHGQGVGVVIDGCPAGLPLEVRDIQLELNKRKPGQNKYASPRKENDKVEILSGVFEGITTGTPISLMVKNTDQRPKDYSNIVDVYRPGHADFTFDEKYGLRDYRGGGRSSARETIGRVAAGAIAKKILKEFGITLLGYTRSVGPVVVDMADFDASQINENLFRMPDAEKAIEAGHYVDDIIKEGNSIGGTIECVVTGVPTGLGETVFDKLDANLAKAVMSIGAIKAVEIGAGVTVADKKGFDNNDFSRYEDGKLIKETNHAGGIIGGMSDGSPIIVRATVKPTASIHIVQPSVTKQKENHEIMIEGRHDPVIVPRAVTILEAMTALVLVDALMMNMTAKMDYLRKIYSN